jgi:hypothetical protein
MKSKAEEGENGKNEHKYRKRCSKARNKRKIKIGCRKRKKGCTANKRGKMREEN